MTTFEDYYQDRLAEDLQDLLAKRLKLNKTWNNVELSTKKNKLVVRWFDPKKDYGNDDRVFQEHAIPFRLDAVQIEIRRQFEKLQEDEKCSTGRK